MVLYMYVEYSYCPISDNWQKHANLWSTSFVIVGVQYKYIQFYSSSGIDIIMTTSTKYFILLCLITCINGDVYKISKKFY